jgi:MoxR-like ATPase
VLAGMADVEALRTLRDEGVPSLLAGPPGTGKTSLVEAAFPDLITVAGDGDTTVGDFVGEYTQKPDGTYEFIYGPLIRAMQEGRVLFIDDATLISPAVLAVCYPAMFSPEFTITERCLPGTRAWLRCVRVVHVWVCGPDGSGAGPELGRDLALDASAGR